MKTSQQREKNLCKVRVYKGNYNKGKPIVNCLRRFNFSKLLRYCQGVKCINLTEIIARADDLQKVSALFCCKRKVIIFMADRKNVKKRNWAFVLYPESAPFDWSEQVQLTGLHCAISPLQDKDMNAT